MQEKQDTQEIPVKDIIFTLCKRMKIIVIFPVIIVTLFSYWNYNTKLPVYESRATLYTIDKSSTNISEIVAVEKLMVIYQLLGKTSEVREMTAELLGYPLADCTLGLSINTENHTMAVTSASSNPAMAANAANAYASAIIVYLKNTMGVTNISILEPAILPSSPSGPMRQRPIFIAGSVGLVLGIAAVCLIEFSNTTIRTPEDVEKLYDLPVLAEIGRYNKGKKK